MINNRKHPHQILYGAGKREGRKHPCWRHVRHHKLLLGARVTDAEVGAQRELSFSQCFRPLHMILTHRVNYPILFLYCLFAQASLLYSLGCLPRLGDPSAHVSKDLGFQVWGTLHSIMLLGSVLSLLCSVPWTTATEPLWEELVLGR